MLNPPAPPRFGENLPEWITHSSSLLRTGTARVRPFLVTWGRLLGRQGPHKEEGLCSHANWTVVLSEPSSLSFPSLAAVSHIVAEGEVGFSCNDPFPLSHVWLQTWKRGNQAAGTILVGRALLLSSFPDFPGGLPIPGWLGGPIPVKPGKIVPASFPLSTYLHSQCLLFLLLSRPHQKNTTTQKQAKSLSAYTTPPV